MFRIGPGITCYYIWPYVLGLCVPRRCMAFWNHWKSSRYVVSCPVSAVITFNEAALEFFLEGTASRQNNQYRLASGEWVLPTRGNGGWVSIEIWFANPSIYIVIDNILDNRSHRPLSFHSSFFHGNYSYFSFVASREKNREHPQLNVHTKAIVKTKETVHLRNITAVIAL